MKYIINSEAPGVYPCGTLLLAHGAGAPMDSDFMNLLAELLSNAGVTVVRFEFPYMAQRREDGKKRPPNRMPQLIEYFKGAIDEISGRAELPKPLLLGGKSMGGRIASMLVNYAPVAGVCCFGYPFCPPGKPEKLAERVEHLLTAQKPVRIFQGTRDPFSKLNELSAIQFSKLVKIEWLEAGDHDLKPLVASGFTQQQHLNTVSQEVVRLFEMVQ